jgi:hypothetical protein
MFNFQEFDSREAAEESVAKYHEGYFMGNKIRVELSHGGGRTAKFAGDPGACFKCAQMGHWARFEILFLTFILVLTSFFFFFWYRECPNNTGP